MPSSHTRGKNKLHSLKGSAEMTQLKDSRLISCLLHEQQNLSYTSLMIQVAPGTIHEQQLRGVQTLWGASVKAVEFPQCTSLTHMTESEKKLSFSPTY